MTCVQVSRTAKMMITQGGFSKRLGQIAWAGNQNTFLGQQMGQPSDCSGETSDEIDQEVKSLVDRAYRCAPAPPMHQPCSRLCSSCSVRWLCFAPASSCIADCFP